MDHNCLPITQTTRGISKDEVTLFDVPIANVTSNTMLYWVYRRLCERQKTTLHFVNAHCCNTLVKDSLYKQALANADCLLPDGFGISTAMRFRGIKLQENLNGTDFIPKIIEYCSNFGISVFFLGGQENVAKKAADHFANQYPTLSIAGTHHGFFPQEQTETVIRMINQSKAGLLLVGFGVPRQEIWLDEHREELDTLLDMGVGGFFDYYSNRIPRAPSFLRRLGIEWMWRLAMEPRRLWQRYILGNPLFLVRAWRDASKRRAIISARLRPKNFLPIRRSVVWSLKKKAVPIFKRILDVTISSVSLFLLAPLCILVASAIRLESQGPIFFGQIRVGLKGENFKMWKFRSMYQNAETKRHDLLDKNEMKGGINFKMRLDPRITRVGKIIRRLSIDELPQLWNVLIGDMSLVGPRPALPDEVSNYSLKDRCRLMGKPGITGIWQVSGRSDIPFPQQVEMDLEYLNEARLRTDIKLLAKTVPAVITGRGAY